MNNRAGICYYNHRSRSIRRGAILCYNARRYRFMEILASRWLSIFIHTIGILYTSSQVTSSGHYIQHTSYTTSGFSFNPHFINNSEHILLISTLAVTNGISSITAQHYYLWEPCNPVMSLSNTLWSQVQHQLLISSLVTPRPSSRRISSRVLSLVICV